MSCRPHFKINISQGKNQQSVRCAGCYLFDWFSKKQNKAQRKSICIGVFGYILDREGCRVVAGSSRSSIDGCV